MRSDRAYGVSVALELAALVFLVLVVTACASEPTVVHEPVEVKVPVMVRCDPKPVYPPAAWATDVVPFTADYFERVRAMAEELAQRMAYEIELKAALAGCTSPTEKQP